MIGQRELTFEDYKRILRRRIWVLVVPALCCALTAYVVSLFLPSRYTSETLVLVEEPTVPQDFVKSVVGGDLSQRLATMQEQILSRTRLQQIIESSGLYKEEIGKRPMEEMVGSLRKSIKVTPLKPMAETRSRDLPGFTVSVMASQPQIAQQICKEITSIFMQQNLLLRERRSEDTTQFLTKQLEAAKARLNEQDSKLATFKRRYLGELPDDMQMNVNLLTGMAAQTEAVTQALNRAQQEKVFAESMLNQQLAGAAKGTSGGDNPVPLSQQLVALQNQLHWMQGRYTADHPDVVKMKADVAQLQKRIQESEEDSSRAASKKDKGTPVEETPQIQQLRAQVHQAEMTIQQRTAEQARLQRDINRLQASLQLSPAVEQQYKAVTRDYQTALSIYNDLLKKQSDSEMATDLERRQQGEQFRVLDPPNLPQKPSFPDRPLFGLGGLAGGLAIGIAIAFLLEIQDTTLRTDRDVEAFLQVPTLGMIPSIDVPGSDSKRSVSFRHEQAGELVRTRSEV